MHQIRRIVVLLAGVTGLLGLFAGSAQAGMNLQHCEPVLHHEPHDVPLT